MTKKLDIEGNYAGDPGDDDWEWHGPDGMTDSERARRKELICVCSCGKCGPGGLHDCGTAACTGGET